MANEPWTEFQSKPDDDGPWSSFAQPEKPKEAPTGNPLTNWLSATPEGNSADKRTLGTGEALSRSFLGRGAELAQTAYDAIPSTIAERAVRHAAGMQDTSHALDDYAKEQQLKPTEQYSSNAQRTAAGLAGIGPDVATAVATGGIADLPLLARAIPAVAKAAPWVQRGVHGLASMVLPAVTTGRETYERGREQGEGVLEAGTRAVKAGGETLLGGAGPAGPTGGVIKRVLGGAATNAAVAEGLRRLHNATSSDSEQEAYDPAQTISAAVLGGTLHGALGERAKEKITPKTETPPPAYTPTELTAMADQRIAELGAKKNLSPDEQEEHDFLQANRLDHDELADRLGADVKPETKDETAPNTQPPNEPPGPPPAGAAAVDEEKAASLLDQRNARQTQIDELKTRRGQLNDSEKDQLINLQDQQALTNPLTGLPNKEAFKAAQASGDYSHTYSLDARGFKSINDKFGHNAGDDVLRGIGQHLAETLGNDPNVSIFHVSGDEFPLLSKGDQSAKVKAALDQLTSKKITAQVTEKDGTIHDVEFPGIKVDFGVGKNLDEADAHVTSVKNQAAAAGEYTRRTSDEVQRTVRPDETPVAGRATDVIPTGREGTVEPTTSAAERSEQPGPKPRTESADTATAAAVEPQRGTSAEGAERGTAGRNTSGGAEPSRVQPERISRVTPSGKDVGFRTQKEAALGVAKRGFNPTDYRITKDDSGGYVATRRDNEQTRRAFAESPGTQSVSGSGGVRGGAGVLAESSRTAPAFSRRQRESDGSLNGLPRKVGGFVASAYNKAQAVARDYAQRAGLEYNPPSTYAKINPERGKRIADAFTAMKHDPQNPDVQRAYRKMIDETNAQYQAIKRTGLKVEFIKPGQADPYAGNPRKMTEDVRKNNHMWVFSTRDGFGSDQSFNPKDNPLLEQTTEKISGQPALANDIFRVVHDYFGHVKEGVGFRAEGEENAWRAHSAMFSPEARKAMTTETRGQNSYVNFGEHGETNRTASAADTHYADQKIGLLPDWVVNEGANDEAPSFKRKSVDEAKEILGQRAKFLTSAEFEKQRAKEAQKLVDLLEKLPTAKEMANVALAGQAKRGWYKESAQTLTNVFGPDADRFAALLAATSPQTSVESNLRNALHTWKNWIKAGRPTDRESIVQIMGKSVEGGRGVDSVLNAWINNSVRALTADNPSKVTLSGPKVHSFMQNLRGNTQEVTNDAWMSAYHMVDATILKGALNKEGTEPGKRAGYLALSVRTRQAADALTKLTGDKWTPAEVQETVWSWAKTAYELADSAGETRSVVKLVQDGAITDDLIKATPAFGDLFNADEYKRILGEAGLGDALERNNVARGQESTGAGSQAATPAPDTREVVRAAGRLDKLRKQRAEQTVDNSIPFQRKAGGFFSALSRSVEDAKGAPKKGGEALKQWLDGAQRRGEFKGSERQWLGVDQWLADHPEATRQELTDFVRSNQVEVKPVRNGESPEFLVTGAFNRKFGSRAEAENYLNTLRDAAKREPMLQQKLDEFPPQVVEQTGSGGTKFGNHTLGGGSNYREHLLTLPEREGTKTNSLRVEQRADGNWQVVRRDGTIDKAFRTHGEAQHFADLFGLQLVSHGANFRSGHFDEPNVLAHVRMNDRTTSDGAKALHIEEIQSDWHQKGRKEGYNTPNPKVDAAQKSFDESAARGESAYKWRTENPELATVLAEHFTKKGNPVPDAPLKNTEDWAMLGFKHALREAVETGKDKVTWTTGEQQAERYDLSKKIKRVRYDEDRMLRAWDHSGKEVISMSVRDEGKLPEIIGKDAAEKLINAEQKEKLLDKRDARPIKYREISGLDLKVGGEGMRGFYDKILPKAVEKYVKQWGGKVGESQIDVGPNGQSRYKYVDGRRTDNPEYRAATVHSVDITPAMRESVESGQPLFSRHDASTPSQKITQGAPAHADADSEKLSQALAKATGKPTKLISVDQSALPDALSGALRAFEKATGTKINLVRNLTPEHEDFNAVTLKDGVLHVNENSQNPITVGAVHEFGHDMRETHPELWNELAQEVERQGLLPQWAEEMKARGYGKGDSPVEELTNDAIADAFHNPQFLDRLAQANPSVFSRVAQAFKRFLDTLLGKFNDTGSNRFLSDVDAFRNKLVDVMRRYGVPEAEAETHAFQRKEPTSVKNDTVNAERNERNVDELASEHGQANADAWAKAKAAAEKDPTYGRRLTQAILAHPRPLSKDEVASLLHDRVRISNEYESALSAAEKKDAGAMIRLADAERQLNENDAAARAAGTENALGLQGRQMMARQDFSLANMVRRAKIAEGKDTLPETVMAKVKEIAQRIKDADQAITDRNLPRKKTVDEKMQERMKTKIDKLQKTIADRLKACPL